MKDNKKAIEAYENLSKSLPGDVDVQYELGVLYLQSGEYDKARATFAKVLQSDPKNIKALWQTGVVDNLTGNPQAALEALTQGLTPYHSVRQPGAKGSDPALHGHIVPSA